MGHTDPNANGPARFLSARRGGRLEDRRVARRPVPFPRLLRLPECSTLNRESIPTPEEVHDACRLPAFPLCRALLPSGRRAAAAARVPSDLRPGRQRRPLHRPRLRPAAPGPSRRALPARPELVQPRAGLRPGRQGLEAGRAARHRRRAPSAYPTPLAKLQEGQVLRPGGHGPRPRRPQLQHRRRATSTARPCAANSTRPRPARSS